MLFTAALLSAASMLTTNAHASELPTAAADPDVDALAEYGQSIVSLSTASEWTGTMVSDNGVDKDRPDLIASALTRVAPYCLTDACLDTKYTTTILMPQLDSDNTYFESFFCFDTSD